MRNLKRALSLALASVMLLGMMVVGTSAASYPDVDEKDNVEAIEVLNAVKVMVGDRGNFRPEDGVNRYEMAVITAKLLLGSEEADKYVVSGSFPFTDVPAAHWAYKYVAACYDYGVISGTSSTTYSGTQSLTATQAALIMLRALGYEELTKGATDWRAPVVKQAKLINLFKGVASNPNAKLNRNQVAQLALNTLKATVVETIDNSNTVTTPDGTVVNMGRPSYPNRPSAGADDYRAAGADSVMQLCEKLYGKDLQLNNAGTITDDFGRSCAKWQYKGETVATSQNDPVIVYTKDVKEADVKKDLKNYKYPATASNIHNNGFKTASQTLTDAAIAAQTGKGTVVEVYADSSTSNITDVVVIQAYLGKVTKVSDKNEEITVTLDTATGESITTDKGYGDYAVDDLLMVVPKYSSATAILNTSAKEIMDIADVTEVKEAELTYRKDGKITVGGSDYNAAKVLANSTTAIAGLTLGSDVDLVLDAHGYVVKAGGTTNAPGDYIYVYSVYEISSLGEDTYYALGVLKDGTIKELEIDASSAKKLSNHARGPTTEAGNFTEESGIKKLFSYTTSGGVATLTYAKGATPASDAAYGHVSSATSIKSSDKVLNSKHYFDSSVTFIAVSGDKASKLKADIYTGVQSVSTASDIAYVTTKSVNDSTNGTISLVFVFGSATTASDDLIYVKSASAVGAKRIDGTTVSTYEVYINGEKTEIPIKTAPTADKFYTYSVNKDGVYTLDQYTNKVNSAQSVSNLYSGTITTTGGTALTNYDISRAQIIDLTDNDVDTAGRLQKLVETGATVKVASVYNDDDKVIDTLYVTEASVALDTITAGAGKTTIQTGPFDNAKIDTVTATHDGTALTVSAHADASGDVAITVAAFAAVQGKVIKVTIETTDGFTIIGTTTVT